MPIPTEPPLLPIEIVELIIDGLLMRRVWQPLEVLQHLKTCSLVCRTWSDLCQRRIFAFLEIGHRIAPKDINFATERRLIRILEEKPSLMTHVKHLSYVGGRLWDECRRVDPSLSVFLQFPRVSRLSMSCITGSFEKCGRNGYYGFRAILTRYLSTGNLSLLSISGIKQLPIHDILASSSLKGLSLQSCTFKTEKEIPGPQDASLKYLRLESNYNVSWDLFRSCTQLETLVIERTHDLLFKDLHTIEDCLPNLKLFRVLMSDMEANKSFSRVLGGVGPVEGLSFQSKQSMLDILLSMVSDVILGTGMDIELAGPLLKDIEKCVYRCQSSLRILCLQFQICDAFKPLLITICDTLASIQGNNVFEELDIVLHYDIPNAVSQCLAPDLDEWTRFAALIADHPASFPFLRRVSLLIVISDRKFHGPRRLNRDELDAFENDFQRVLGPVRAMTRDILFQPVIKVSTEPHYFFPAHFDRYSPNKL
ncbi:hypothetical protein CVT24_012872 [Panaeolus cyanescens]|uniref:F-box domain-containing protein n=1 Tax=Panaeolus cyanescens TaxID=181874 RepID=A0A409WR20_9AGAR|nr:hypothetical protein CVT24_012872 [Panaeolus cyanescens]